MAKYICKKCGREFEYCRGCHLLPVPHMRDGFCSKSCQEAYKNIKEVQPIEEIQVEEIKMDQTEDSQTSSFNTEECISFEDIETAPIPE